MSAGDELPSDADLGVDDLHDAAAYDGDPYDRPVQHDPRVFAAVIDQARGRAIVGEIERDSPRVTDTEAGTP